MKINNDTWPEMMSFLTEGRFFFWGAGLRLSDFLCFMKQEKIQLFPENIIDNDQSKRNTEKNVLGESVSVILWSDVQIKIDETIVIIITVKNYQEIISQLEKCVNTNNLHILTYEYAISEYYDSQIGNKKLLFPLKRTNAPIIPKVIHYCWFGGKSLPEKNRSYVEHWKQLCPDYKIIEWNESNYDISKCLYMEQAWKNKYWSFVSDYARLDIIYEHGGIYMDTDVEMLKNLNNLLYQEAYMGFEQNLYVNTGLGFGAREKHPMIKEMRDEYNERFFLDEDGMFNLTACPHYQTNYLKRHGLVTNGQHQQIGGMTIYPASVLCSFCYQSKREVRTPYSYTIHHYDASWQVCGKMEK